MEMKWIAIMGISMVLIAALAGGVASYHRNQCRVAAIQAGMTAEQVEKTCQ